jgi:hypothetical protein
LSGFAAKRLNTIALGKATDEIAVKVATEGGSGRGTLAASRAPTSGAFQGTFPTN